MKSQVSTPPGGSPQGCDWQLALREHARYTPLTLQGAARWQAAALIDHDLATAEVAGLIVSRPTASSSLVAEVATLADEVRARLPGASVTLKAPSSAWWTHDGFDLIAGFSLEVVPGAPTTAPALRDQLVAALLGKSVPELGKLPADYGVAATAMAVRLAAVRRFAFKRDAQGQPLRVKGQPVDDGDASQWHVVLLGGVARQARYDDRGDETGIVLDDLASGTGLALPGAGVGTACELTPLAGPPKADVIWVVDRNTASSALPGIAQDFLSRAQASGLDLRLCVTGTCAPDSTSPGCAGAVGRCCDGGTAPTDRFLAASEAAAFATCLADAPGELSGKAYGLSNAMSAVSRHLPRAAGLADRIRPDAKLMIVVASAEPAQEVLDAGLLADASPCQLDAVTWAHLDYVVQPYYRYFTGQTDPEVAATVSLLGGVCGSSCISRVGHGYWELMQGTGGATGDLCQQDLGLTLQQIIDGAPGPDQTLVLDRRPISASVAAALDGTQLVRSRQVGFDYRPHTNSLALVGITRTKASELIATYRWWTH